MLPIMNEKQSWIMDLGACVKGRADVPKACFLPRCATTAEVFTILVAKESLAFSSNPEHHRIIEPLGLEGIF